MQIVKCAFFLLCFVHIVHSWARTFRSFDVTRWCRPHEIFLYNDDEMMAFLIQFIRLFDITHGAWDTHHNQCNVTGDERLISLLCTHFFFHFLRSLLMCQSVRPNWCRRIRTFEIATFCYTSRCKFNYTICCQDDKREIGLSHAIRGFVEWHFW